MNEKTGAKKAGWAALGLVAAVIAVVLILFFLEYLVIGFMLFVILLIILAVAAALIIGVMIIPMYIIKDTVVEEGSYSIDDVKAVSGNKED